MATTRAGETTETQFELPLDHRRRLVAGDYRPLVVEEKPYGCEPGASYVLAWSRQARSHVEGVVIDIPRTAVCWIVITDIRRHPKAKDWLVRFTVHDKREPVYYLAPGHGYTTTRYRAIDDLEVVPRDWLRHHIKAKSDDAHAERVKQSGEVRKGRHSKRRIRQRAFAALAA